MHSSLMAQHFKMMHEWNFKLPSFLECLHRDLCVQTGCKRAACFTGATMLPVLPDSDSDFESEDT